MGSVNRVILVGRLGADPEIKITTGGATYAKLRLATSESKKSANGGWSEITEWHRLTAFNSVAERCAKLSKGREIYIEGRLQTRSWEKDGVKQYSTDVLVDRLVPVGGNYGKPAAESAPPAENPAQEQETGAGDDIPF